MSKSRTRAGRVRTRTNAGVSVSGTLSSLGTARIRIRIVLNRDVEYGSSREAENWVPGLQRFDLREEHVLLPVDAFKVLFEAELCAPKCLQFSLLPRIPA